MNADLWGLVLGFALRLDLLDRACLADLRNCAQTCKALATAVTRVAKSAITLRARIHRVFDFKDPLKSQVRASFPHFLGDEFYASAPRSKPLCLVELANHIIKYKDVSRWVASAEGRPARLENRKRKRAERERLLRSELEDYNLPVDEYNNAWIEFVTGHTRSTRFVIEAMRDLKEEREQQQRDLADQEARDTLWMYDPRFARYHGQGEVS
jgi:hypothetical protein